MRALAALPSASDFGGTGFLQASADVARFNVEAWQGGWTFIGSVRHVHRVRCKEAKAKASQKIIHGVKRTTGAVGRAT